MQLNKALERTRDKAQQYGRQFGCEPLIAGVLVCVEDREFGCSGNSGACGNESAVVARISEKHANHFFSGDRVPVVPVMKRQLFRSP